MFVDEALGGVGVGVDDQGGGVEFGSSHSYVVDVTRGGGVSLEGWQPG